ncbi:SURF1 family protein [Phenylobacterium sp.]|uniref:SURF1 family protein n=1 Tax=Phenylobacterium sp. TaxID=1871053 RepID=UPI0027208705|nr:SURF1 family cytochrome oxidase biogenesis protein [Phenylobacterium sp.]MDO8380812.1 SURF1 family cytochrome oxidase biogenesis protein [Phenylobacterium sp.]
MTDRTDAAPRKGFPLVLTLATLIAAAILVWLGTWQLQRLAWKQDLLARVAALQAAPAKPLGPALDALAHGANADFTRVVVDCPGLGSAPYLELYSVRESGAGLRLISACVVESAKYRTILVDRGFVADTISARPPVDLVDRTPVRLAGVLRSPDKASFVTPKNDLAGNHWYSRDIPAMAAHLKAPSPAPIILAAETSSNPTWQALKPEPLPAEIPNRHLEYALTWFGLAGALVAVYAAMLWRWWKA